jgi:hypothetical protein
MGHASVAEAGCAVSASANRLSATQEQSGQDAQVSIAGIRSETHPVLMKLAAELGDA